MINKINLLIILFLTACGAHSLSATYQVTSQPGFVKRGPATICLANETEAGLAELAMAADIISSLRKHEIYPAEEDGCDIRLTIEEEREGENRTVVMNMLRGGKLSTATVTADSKSWQNSAPILRELALAYGGNDKWELSCTSIDSKVTCKKYLDREKPVKVKPEDQVPEFIKPAGRLRNKEFPFAGEGVPPEAVG